MKGPIQYEHVRTTCFLLLKDSNASIKLHQVLCLPAPTFFVVKILHSNSSSHSVGLLLLLNRPPVGSNPINALGKFSGHCHRPVNSLREFINERAANKQRYIPGGTNTFASGKARENGPANTLCSMP